MFSSYLITFLLRGKSNLSNLIYKLKNFLYLDKWIEETNLLDRTLRLKKKKIDSLSRIVKKLFSILIFPRIDICSFLYSPQSIPPLRDFIIKQCANNRLRCSFYGRKWNESIFFFLSFFFLVRFQWEKGVDITIREPFSTARVPTRNNDGAFGIRNCANCSFSLGDYRRDIRDGITTSYSRKKNGKDESLIDLIRSLPLDAFLYFLVDLSNPYSLFFLFFLFKRKKKRFYSSVIVLFLLLFFSSFFLAR